MLDEPILVAHPRLVPVVELEPSAYATRAHERPLGPDLAAAEDRYWRESLADARLVLEPLDVGSWLVPLSRLLEERALRAILQVHATRYAEQGPPTTLETLTDEVPPLPGGVALLDAEQVVVSPGCCADLGDLSNWEKAATDVAGDWDMLWIGHPWASWRTEGERVLLRKEAEYAPPPPPILLSVDRAALREAVSAAAVERRAFAARLAPIVRDWLGDDAWLDEALALLVGRAR